MRVTHNLWKVQNGWILVPEGCDSILSPSDAAQALVFKDLQEFSKWTPKRVRRKRTKQTKETNNADQH